MSLHEPIGGYFGLETAHGKYVPPLDAKLLNSARNCFEYVLRSQKPELVYMPKFMCDVMLEPLKSLKINYEFYQINELLEIKEEPKVQKNQLLLYTNYFGVKTAYCKKLAKKYKQNLVLDYAQAFLVDPEPGCHTIYSPRKFFGLPDGGLLYSNSAVDEHFETDISYRRMSHLLKRTDVGAEAGYADFSKNDAALSNQPIKHMSRLTKTLLSSIDVDSAKKKRSQNMEQLHRVLHKTNELSFALEDSAGALCYPYLTTNDHLRQKLIDHKIFVATYWPNILQWCDENELEYKMTKFILPLPIDQRYGEQHMQRIIEVIND